MKKIYPNQTHPKDFHQYLLGAIAPRPIALASTVDKEGHFNLAPFSYFNAFSSNPPILIFSANLRIKDKSAKDTLQNVIDTKEVVINMVDYNMLRQMAISSIEYSGDVNEFDMSGLTPIPSEKVKAMRVKESPVQMECKVREVISMGENAGAANLIVCEVLLIHIKEEVFDDKGKINPHKMDLMGRLGRTFYVRASGEAIHSVRQHILLPAIGFPALPESIRNSHILTGNDLGLLAGILEIPSQERIEKAHKKTEVIKALEADNAIEKLHYRIQQLLREGNIEEAASIAWINNK